MEKLKLRKLKSEIISDFYFLLSAFP